MIWALIYKHFCPAYGVSLYGILTGASSYSAALAGTKLEQAIPSCVSIVFTWKYAMRNSYFTDLFGTVTSTRRLGSDELILGSATCVTQHEHCTFCLDCYPPDLVVASDIHALLILSFNTMDSEQIDEVATSPSPHDTSSLPQELWDQFIDEAARNDGKLCNRAELLSYALVCRAWLPRARFHLFRVVPLNNAENVHLLADTIRASPALGLLVQHLMLVGPRKIGPWRPVRDTDSLRRLMQLVRELLAPCLSRVSTLTLTSEFDRSLLLPVQNSNAHDAEVDSPWRPSHTLGKLEWLISPFALSAVRNIELDGVLVHDCFEMCKTLAELPNLSSLRCTRVKCESEGTDTSINTSLTLPNLRDLTISAGGSGCASQGRLLAVAGPLLRTLILRINLWPVTEDIMMADEYNLSRFPYLHHLRLSIHDAIRYYPSHYWISHMLSNVKSTSLSHVALEYGKSGTPTRSLVLDRLRCQDIDNILAQSRFPRLRRFAFYFRDTPERQDWWRSEIAARCPWMAENGICKAHLYSNSDIQDAELWASDP
ncbi:hypothetical protein CERSUDRAFT_125227 [Gelatoporia subvermispora B]|uniref:Uncharacterized protein n=1 Tax=Ceriporiopsis subvermispora (strain B) TaxID=914234 RepID=M2PFD4_CERS8|nr:hypothetical protein CERSUDRAFT_125227 [Gelatoporia subvermispora B]